ncbi:MAG: hypothetical protein WCK27_19295 [Verrucomicrobiota bacterium]
MESNWAAEHLQVIRTLMERSALYRRALAPIMIFNGATGLIAAVLGRTLNIGSPRSFILFWAGVGVVALAGSFLLVRRQALKESEPFWSPPTRRITLALLPPLVAGLMISAVIFARAGSAPGNSDSLGGMLWLPLIWVVLYGCAFHAAGFFMPRGMRLFGWAFIMGGCGLFAVGFPDGLRPLDYAHGVMGCFFGGLHLAYGVYLYFTEQRGNEP